MRKVVKGEWAELEAGPQFLRAEKSLVKGSQTLQSRTKPQPAQPQTVTAQWT